MPFSWRSGAFIPALAVVAVAVAALAAALASGDAPEEEARRVSGPPEGISTMPVVKAPALEAENQRVVCRDCAQQPAVPSGRY